MSEREAVNVRPETAKAIQSQDLRVSAAGNFPGNKFAGVICAVDPNGHHRILLSTKPVFENEADAVSHMEKVVQAVKELKRE